MNIVDKKFYDLMKCLEVLDINEILDNMKAKFYRVPEETRISTENFLNQFGYWGTLDTNNQDYTVIELKAKCLKEHRNDFIELYQSLKDYKSKKILYGILNNWYQYDFVTLSEVAERNYKHYFDLDLIPHCHNEVLVDLGAYTGDTILDFFDTYGIHSYNKIYCYEMTPTTFSTLKNNLYQYDNIIFNKKACSNFSGNSYIVENNESASANQIINHDNGNILVPVTTIDNDIEEKITMIKMDIEGDEQKALDGCRNHIIADHPILLISVYHHNNDLFEIPKKIKEMNPNYDFYLRYYGGCIYPTEIVLIAIPTVHS